jgi:hypothetical protein
LPKAVLLSVSLAIPALFDADRRGAWLDRAGIGLSALCIAHCLTSAIVVTALASFGGVLFSPWLCCALCHWLFRAGHHGWRAVTP